MTSLKIVSTSANNVVRTCLLLNDRSIWTWEGPPYASPDSMVELERIVTSLLVSKGERSIVVSDVSERVVNVSTMPPIYRTIPEGYSDFYSMVLSSQEAISVGSTPRSQERLIEDLLTFEEEVRTNKEILDVEEFPEVVMSRVDEKDPLTTKDREKWMRDQEAEYLKGHEKESASVLEAARRRFHQVRTSGRQTGLPVASTTRVAAEPPE